MATPTSRESLIQYSLRQLGAPVVDINVDWQQCEDRLDDALQYFTERHFDGGVTTANQIYVINISRERYKQSIQPGSFNLRLLSGSKVIQLTDDSNTTSLTRFIGENRIFYIISGSNGNAYTAAASIL